MTSRGHPLADGNGRMARIVMNWVLAKQGLPLTVVAGSTFQQRAEYVRAIRDSTENVHASFRFLAGVCSRAWGGA